MDFISVSTRMLSSSGGLLKAPPLAPLKSPAVSSRVLGEQSAFHSSQRTELNQSKCRGVLNESLSYASQYLLTSPLGHTTCFLPRRYK